MKQGWEFKTLDELGADIPYPIGDGDHGQIKPSFYKTEGIPYIRVRDIGWGKFKPEKMVYISEEVHNENLKSELKPGDILLAKTGATIGKCCIVPDSVQRANTTSSVGKITVDQSQVLPRWVLFWFLSDKFVKFIWSISKRAAQPGFNNRDIKQFKIPLPQIAEQERIISNLDQAFSAIDTAKLNVEKNLENAKELFQSKLNEIFSQKGEGWIERKLIDVCEKTKNINWKNFPDSNFKYVDLSAVSRVFLTVTEAITINASDAPSRAKKIIKKNDVIFATTRPTLKRIAAVSDEFNNQICSTGFSVLRPIKNLITQQFIYYFLQTDYFMNRMESLQRGASYPAVSDSDVKDTSIFMPQSLKEQLEVSLKLERLKIQTKSLVFKYQQELDSLEELKKSILEKAFNGEL